jgi:molybdopterin-binding protein
MAMGLSSLDKPDCQYYRPFWPDLSTPLSIPHGGIKPWVVPGHIDVRMRTSRVQSSPGTPRSPRAPVSQRPQRVASWAEGSNVTGLIVPRPFPCASPQTPRHVPLKRLILHGMPQSASNVATRLRVGQAAEMLGVSVETLRRWETEGRLRMERSDGGQRLIDIDEVSRLLDERRRAATDRPIVAQSARNRFPGIVTRIESDRVAAVVEVIAGPHRMVSLMTAEAVEELGLKVGDEAVCVVKATNVIVEIPSAKEARA